jgi:hypothetical protein
MNQDITFAEIRRLKDVLQEKVQATGIGELAREFHEKTGIKLNAVEIDWLDITRSDDPYYGYRFIPGRLGCRYERIEI